MLDLKQVRNFVAVAEMLNYRAAAERLHISQPPLSASIRQLEERLGCTLFERSRRGTALTPVGSAVLDAARRVLAEVAQFEVAVGEAVSGAGRGLSIAYVPSAVYDLLPKIIPLYRTRYPQVQIRLVEQPSESILDAVEERKVDIGLMRTPLPRPTNASVRIFQTDPFIAALPDRPHWRNCDVIDISDLRNEPFVCFGSPYVRSLTMLLWQHAGFTPRIAQEASGLPTVVSLVQCGLGVALVPSVAQRWPVPGVLFRPLTGVPEGLELGLAVVWVARERSPAVQAFLELIGHLDP